VNYNMNEREQILDSINNYNLFLIPSKKSLASCVVNLSRLYTVAKELEKENLISWGVHFSKNDINAIVLVPYSESDYTYDLTEKEKNYILNKINKQQCYILGRKNKTVNWLNKLKFLKSLVKQNKLDWFVDFKKQKYCFTTVTLKN